MDALPGWSKPSAEEIAILQRLTGANPRRFLFKRCGVEERRRLLATLVSRQNLWMVLPLVDLATDRDRVLARTAAHAVKALVDRLPTTLLLRLDQRCRGSFWDWAMSPRLRIDMLQEHGDSSDACLGVASCHPNGHTREAALRCLARRGPSAFAWLLVRLNDWVPEVRSVAEEAALAALAQGGPGLAITHLGLLLRLQERSRSRDLGVMRRVDHVLRETACRSALIGALSIGDKTVSVFAARVLLESTESELPDLLPCLASAHLPRVRLLAARACHRLEGDGFLRAFELLARDPFPSVRTELLQALVEKVGDHAVTALRSALLDPSSWVRCTARYHLRRLVPQSVDFRDFYRDHLTDQTAARLAAAALGLGETGVAEDTHLLEPLVAHRAVLVRRAVIRSLALLAPDRYVQLFLKLLLDRSPGVSREATVALCSSSGSPGRTELWHCYESAGHQHGRRNAIRVMAKLPKWDRLELLGQALADANLEERELLAAMLAQWARSYNRSFVQVSADQLGRIRVAIAGISRQIGPGLHASLESLLPE